MVIAIEKINLLKTKINKSNLTKQQKKTLLGQVKAGNVLAAVKGFEKLLRKEELNE